MKSFDLHEPTSVSQAVGLLDQLGAGGKIVAVANALIAGGVTQGVFLWVANWSLSEAQALAMITSAGGPFPVIGVQFRSGSFVDTDVWSKTWLDDVSASGPVRHVTDGKLSLTAMAASRGMHAGSWMSLQQRLGGKGAADALGSAIPKAGLPGYSNTP